MRDPQILTIAFLVGGFNPSEKYEFVKGKNYISHIIMENKKCLKSPASIVVNPRKMVMTTGR